MTTAFLACCRDERSLSHHTLRAYAQDLRTFARYVVGNDLADLFSRDDILGYHRYMRETVGFALQLRADGRPMWMQHGRVASITGQARSTLTRENGQPTDSNLAQPSSVILLRARTPICASVF